MPYTIFDCTNAVFDRCPRLFTNSIPTVNGGVNGSLVFSSREWKNRVALYRIYRKGMSR